VGTYAFAIPPLTLHCFVLFQSAHPTFSFPSSFFSNKAAVAGVFSVVGLVGLVILIALVTNAIRRRRAKQFDNELFAATQEAAATAPNPNFLDDDDDSEQKLNGSSPGYGGGYNGETYSDGSHGPNSYNMSNIGRSVPVGHSIPVGHSVPVGEIYDPYASGGAAGIGVARTRSTNQNFTTIGYPATFEGGSPYPKFIMGPNTSNKTFGDFLGQQQQYPQQSPPPQEYATVGRTKSSSTAGGHHSTPSLTQMSPPRSAAAPGLANPPPQVYPSHKAEHSGGSTMDDAAYGGFVIDGADEDREEAPRVLRVC
jgi:hypothetical protein